MKRKITLTLALTLLLLTACQLRTMIATSRPQSHVRSGETEEIITDDLGDIRFDGEEFTMYLAYPLGNFVMEEETGDTVDDAVFERNRLVESGSASRLHMSRAATTRPEPDKVRALRAYARL